MSGRENVGRGLRSLWATLAAICLLGMGVALVVTRYTQSQLERDATRDAHKLAVSVLQPMLLPADVEAPVRGVRYDVLLAAMREDVLAGPINGLKLWQNDGTILFADDAKLVGDKDAAMRDPIHEAISGTAQSAVAGESYRTLVSLRVGEDRPVLVTAELDQPHAAIVEEAKDRWYPWAVRAGWAAGVFVALYVATALFFGLLGRLSRSAARREKDAEAPKPRTRAVPAPQKDASLPAYMQPGFREEVEARRKVEAELATSERERAELRERLRRLEGELEEARRRASESEPAERVLP